MLVNVSVQRTCGAPGVTSRQGVQPSPSSVSINGLICTATQTDSD